MARESQEYRAVRNRERAPTHPGRVLKNTVLPALHLSTAAAARNLGVSRQLLHRILVGKGAVTPEMAVRLGKLCGNGPALWIRMQEAHDLWHAERKLVKELASIPTLEAAPEFEETN